MKVGVFVDAPADFVMAAIQRAGLTMAQFHGAETPEYCGQFGVMTMKAFRVQNAASLEAIGAYAVDAVLLDAYVPGQLGGTGAAFRWSWRWRAKRFGKPIFLAGGLTPENVAEAIRVAQPFGVDVASGVGDGAGEKGSREDAGDLWRRARGAKEKKSFALRNVRGAPID